LRWLLASNILKALCYMRCFYLLVVFVLKLGVALAQAQQGPTPSLNGQVIDQTTGQPIGEVSIRLNEQALGALSNSKGKFYLTIPAGYATDSVRLSHLGYATRTWSVAAFRQQLEAGGGRVWLRAQQVPLAEAQVSAKALQRRVLGNSSDAPRPFYYFTDNTPGNQIGQRIRLKRAGWLEAVSFHLAACSYDTLYLRLNVYALEADLPTKQLLREPVYIRLTKPHLTDRVSLDLRQYELWLTADVVVALELLRPLGPGTLTFSSARLPGPCYYIDLPGDGHNHNIPPRGTHNTHEPWQQSADGSAWRKMTGVSVGINATVLQESR
jgi:hypothetical protein